MRRGDLFFERPADLFASQPPEKRGRGRDDVRLMVSTPDGNTHHAFGELPSLLRPGDLLVVNESATLPASLPATCRLGNILLNLSTRFADDLWVAEPRWSHAQPGPLPLTLQDTLQIGDARAKLLLQYPGIPRLWLVKFDRPANLLMADYGRPIHYSYAPEYPLETYQTLFSRIPGSAEMPSAARPITEHILELLLAHGIGVIGIILHTGVSSLEIEDELVEHQPIYPEPFWVPSSTANTINAVRAHSGRIIAVGTTVVRALESGWTGQTVRACRGSTSLYIHPENGVHVVDGILTGLHDPVTSHLAMLSAFTDIDSIKKAYSDAIEQHYLWHEFGDSHLIWKNPQMQNN